MCPRGESRERSQLGNFPPHRQSPIGNLDVIGEKKKQKVDSGLSRNPQMPKCKDQLIRRL